jgi:hypothetical protein
MAQQRGEVVFSLAQSHGLLKNSASMRFVTGHGFSHADNSQRINWASAPAYANPFSISSFADSA